MASSSLFNGVASWNVRDENTGKFAPRRRAGSDVALGITDHTGAVVVASKTGKAPTERAKWNAKIRKQERAAQESSLGMMAAFFADAECDAAPVAPLASAEWLAAHRVA